MGGEGGRSGDGRGICVIGLRGWPDAPVLWGRDGEFPSRFFGSGARTGLCPPTFYVFTPPLFTLLRDNMK